MAKQKDNVEFVESTEEVKELRKYSIKGWLTGSVLAKASARKQIPFVIFVAVLAIMYIANRYHAETLMRNTMRLQQELDELRAESITTASELMFASRQSQVLKMVEENKLGLKESRVPPRRIKMRD